MADSEWGQCKDCKWFQIEPGVRASNNTKGLCIDEELQPFRLRISGNSGGDRFMAGKLAHAEGSSAARGSAVALSRTGLTTWPRLIAGTSS